MDRQYNYQKKHGQTIQRPKETWTGRFIACPFFFWSLYCLSMFLLVVVLSVYVSFGRCIACPCFFWSLYCLSMFLLVVVLPVHVSFGRCIVCPCFGNTTTKRNMDRQYNDKKKHGQAIQLPKETWTGNTMTKRKRTKGQQRSRKHYVLGLIACTMKMVYITLCKVHGYMSGSNLYVINMDVQHKDVK
jgi:hypothetical protein